MIGDGKFQAHLSTVEHLLKKLELLDERALAPNRSLGVSRFRHMTYRQIYEECVREYAFDFRLVDQAILFFTKGGTNEHDGALSFSYYDCPFSVLPYQEFVGNQLGVTVLDEEFEQEVAVWGDSLRSEYEQYVATVDASASVTPIRYDYKARDYRAGVHPASHVHFGVGNHIRVGTRRVMNPISFVLLVVRQRYPDQWEQFLACDEADALCRRVREKLSLVNDSYWNEVDDKELALH